MRALPPSVREYLEALSLREKERSFLRYVRVNLFNSSVPQKVSSDYLKHFSLSFSLDSDTPAILKTFLLSSDFSFEDFFSSRIASSEELDRIINGEHPNYGYEWLSSFYLEEGYEKIRRFEEFLLELIEGKDTPLMMNIWNRKLEENQGDDSLALLQLLSEEPPKPEGLESALSH